DEPEEQGERDTRQGAHARDHYLVVGVARLAGEMRHAAEDEEGNAIDLLAETVPHRGVGEFVDQNRTEEQDSGDEADDPVVERLMAGICARRVARRQAPQDKRENRKPGEIDIHLHARDLEETDGSVFCRHELNCPRYVGGWLSGDAARRMDLNTGQLVAVAGLYLTNSATTVPSEFEW